MVQAKCRVCKKEVEVKDPKYYKMHNGAYLMKGTCPISHNSVTEFVSFDKIPKAYQSNIPNLVTKGKSGSKSKSKTKSKSGGRRSKRGGARSGRKHRA